MADTGLPPEVSTVKPAPTLSTPGVDNMWLAAQAVDQRAAIKAEHAKILIMIILQLVEISIELSWRCTVKHREGPSENYIDVLYRYSVGVGSRVLFFKIFNHNALWRCGSGSLQAVAPPPNPETA